MQAWTIPGLGIQMFSNDSPSCLQFLPPFAKKNCNDPFEKLQRFLAQSSKHITHACVCTHICRISLLRLPVFSSPQNDQKPILTFLTGTEVGHPFSTPHALIFYSAQKSRAFHRKAPATFGMCFSFFEFICSVSQITEHLYLITSYEGALSFLLELQLPRQAQLLSD